MSVWPENLPDVTSLVGSEGALVSLSIEVDPRLLESLLEALAQVRFPINPQIYHDAAVIYRYAGGREEVRNVTLVEFPAYAARVLEVRQALAASGFGPDSARVTKILEDLDSETGLEPAPKGAGYLSRSVVKRRAASAHQ